MKIALPEAKSRELETVKNMEVEAMEFEQLTTLKLCYFLIVIAFMVKLFF